LDSKGARKAAGLTLAQLELLVALKKSLLNEVFTGKL
jgi:hypothetical protein